MQRRSLDQTTSVNSVRCTVKKKNFQSRFKKNMNWLTRLYINWQIIPNLRCSDTKINNLCFQAAIKTRTYWHSAAQFGTFILNWWYRPCSNWWYRPCSNFSSRQISRRTYGYYGHRRTFVPSCSVAHSEMRWVYQQTMLSTVKHQQIKQTNKPTSTSL